MNYGETLYDGASELGKLQSLIGFICAIIAAVILICAGLLFYFKDESNNVDTTATIKEINCTQRPTETYDSRTRRYKREIINDCVLTINYNVLDKVYENKLTSSGTTIYYVGASVDITYDKTNPNVVSFRGIKSTYIGYFLSCIALILVACAGFTYWLSQRSKFFSAIQGTSTAVNLISAPFRNNY